MKHLVKKLSTLFIVAVLAVTMLLPTTANAATKSASEIPYAENIILSCGTGYSTTSIRYPEKIKKITSSNNDILDLKYFDGGYWSGNLFTFSYIAAKGTVVLTAKGKSGKQYITNLTINKYVNPVKKFKIGSKNLASQFKKSGDGYAKIKKTQKQKISIKTKKGWKVSSITYDDSRLKKPKKVKNDAAQLPGKSYI
ncbi:MAG: hypothetical protein ACLS8T_10595, partial [Anaerobutyricum sp.]